MPTDISEKGLETLVLPTGSGRLRQPPVAGGIELKRPGVPACAAFDENLTHYKADIPQLFWFNALLIASNGTDSRVGSAGCVRLGERGAGRGRGHPVIAKNAAHRARTWAKSAPSRPPPLPRPTTAGVGNERPDWLGGGGGLQLAEGSSGPSAESRCFQPFWPRISFQRCSGSGWKISSKDAGWVSQALRRISDSSCPALQPA